MPLFHSCNTEHEHDRSHQASRADSVMPSSNDFQYKMRKAASLATLWPRPASSPIAPAGIQDRSPFPPRISSLNRVPPPGWDSPTPPKGPNAKRPATAHAGGVEVSPGTAGINRAGSGTVGAQGSWFFGSLPLLLFLLPRRCCGERGEILAGRKKEFRDARLRFSSLTRQVQNFVSRSLATHDPFCN